MATTSTLRLWWKSWLCKDRTLVKVPILGLMPPINPLAAEAQKALGICLSTMGYRPRQGVWAVQTYNCRPITGGTGYSLHAYGIAWDIDPAYNPYKKTYVKRWSDTIFTPAQIDAVLRIKTKNGKQVFTWGGNWLSTKDYMHFQLDVRPSDIQTGINWATVRGATIDEEDEMSRPILKLNDNGLDVAFWKDALNKAIVKNMIPVPQIPVGTWFSPEMQTAVTEYQKAAQITGRVPQVGALDLYTMLLLVEFGREDE